MSNIDVLLKEFFLPNERFVDVFNAKFFDGRQVLKSECCRAVDTGFTTKKKTQKYVDVARLYEDGSILGLFIIENQSSVDYSMVIRSMSYVVGAYEKQIKKRKLNKKDKLSMVYLIVFYTGEKKWDGATRLSELINVPKEFETIFQDYEMNLIEINGQNSYTFSNKDVRDLVEMTRSIYNQSIHEREKLEYLNTVNHEVKQLVSDITDTEWINEENDKEKIDMCEAEKRWQEAIEARGSANREKEMFDRLIEKGKTIEDIANLFDYSIDEVKKALAYKA